MYEYSLKSLEASSQKYGNCEVCKKSVSEVFIQIEGKHFKNGLTRLNCHTLFGHKGCLKRRQHEGR